MKEKKKNALHDIKTFQNPVEVQVFLRQCMQLREFILENPYEYIEERENDLNIILINNPTSQIKMEEALRRFRDERVCFIDGDTSNKKFPTTTYKYNQIGP
jgi:hypothetical protein